MAEIEALEPQHPQPALRQMPAGGRAHGADAGDDHVVAGLGHELGSGIAGGTPDANSAVAMSVHVGLRHGRVRVHAAALLTNCPDDRLVRSIRTVLAPSRNRHARQFPALARSPAPCRLPVAASRPRSRQLSCRHCAERPDSGARRSRCRAGAGRRCRDAPPHRRSRPCAEPPRPMPRACARDIHDRVSAVREATVTASTNSAALACATQQVSDAAEQVGADHLQRARQARRRRDPRHRGDADDDRPRRRHRRDPQHRRFHRRDRAPDQSAGAQRDDRGGARRRGRARLRRRRAGGQGPLGRGAQRRRPYPQSRRQPRRRRRRARPPSSPRRWPWCATSIR